MESLKTKVILRALEFVGDHVACLRPCRAPYLLEHEGLGKVSGESEVTLGGLCKKVQVDTICITRTRMLRPHERAGALRLARATAFLETKVIQPSESSTRLSWRKWQEYHKG